MLSAASLDRRVQFQRRLPIVNTDRGGFANLGTAVWAGFVENMGTPQDIGDPGLPMYARSGMLTVRDSVFVRSLAAGDRLTMEGVSFDIRVSSPVRAQGFVRLSLVEARSRDMLARALDVNGEVVTIRRPAQGSDPAINATVRAKVSGFTPEEMATGLLQGGSNVVLSAADVEASGFPLPFKLRSDRIVVRNVAKVIESVDDSTHRVGGVLLAYDLKVTGPSG